MSVSAPLLFVSITLGQSWQLICFKDISRCWGIQEVRLAFPGHITYVRTYACFLAFDFDFSDCSSLHPLHHWPWRLRAPTVLCSPQVRYSCVNEKNTSP